MIFFDKKQIITSLFLLFGVIICTASIFKNPIIPGFNPDPSICKANGKYYLVTSTFEYFPGVPVYESTDLINWKQISNVLTRKSQLDLDSFECSQGIYAPTIRYHKGIFYMITTLVGGNKKTKTGNFIVTAKNPKGPWSDPHFIENAPGIDPDLFFDENGKVYMSGTLRTKYQDYEKLNSIWIQELDLSAWKLKDSMRVLVNTPEIINKKSPVLGKNRDNVLAVEGPHLYKKDGWYYSIFSHGGTSYNHAVSVFRSKNIFGPYEENPNNPILTHRDLKRELYVTSTGHADIINYKDDKWAIVYLVKRQFPETKFQLKRHLLGRETCLSLVDWSGDWPVVNPSGQIGRCEIENPLPDLPTSKVKRNEWHDDFKSKELKPFWLFVRAPESRWWSLTNKKGWLEMNLRPETAKELVNPLFICRRQQHVKFDMSTKLSINFENKNEEAGLMMFRERNSFVKYTLFNDKSGNCLKGVFIRNDSSSDSVLFKLPIKESQLSLKMKVDNYKIEFYYSTDNEKKWNPIDFKLDLEQTSYIYSARFTGPMIGLYASSNGTKTNSKVYFDYFNYLPVNEQ